MTNTSRPRTFSRTRTKTLPSLKYCACEGIRFAPRCIAMSRASLGLAEAARIARSPCGDWNVVNRGPAAGIESAGESGISLAQNDRDGGICGGPHDSRATGQLKARGDK